MTRYLPIIFSAPMVRAILDGRKTQMRRIIKPQPQEDIGLWLTERQPTRWRPGRRLWVREKFSGEWPYDSSPPREWDRGGPIWYWADGNPDDGDWTKPKPSIHMPRWASRITLLVTAVRVERLQDISEEDAMAEGILQGLEHVNGQYCYDYRTGFRNVWDHIHGPDAWDANPWVSVTTFERIER